MSSDLASRLTMIAEKGIDFDARTIYINGEVDQKMLLQIPALRIMNETEGPIGIVINSHGGDFEVGMALYDTIRSLRNPTVGTCIGKAFSIAALILQAADTRIILPYSRVMIHNGHMANADPELDTVALKDMAEEFERTNVVYQQVLADRTGQPLAKIAKWCETDTYFSAKEALKNGFVDRIATYKKVK